MGILKRYRWWIAGGILMIVLVALAMRPETVPADITQVARGPLAVTIDEDGETRVREVYTVSAPVGGRMLRLEAEAGDIVQAGKSLLAVIERADPTILDARSRAQAESSVRAAEAALNLARADVARLQAEVEFAQSEYQRAQALRERGTVSQAAEDRSRMELKTRRAALDTAKAALDVRAHELETARAALLTPKQGEARPMTDDCCYEVKAPVSGRVLRVLKESESVIQPGAPLVELGDPTDLEIVADLLSTDAVRVNPGAAVSIEGWGGQGSLNGEVERVEPFGFTKISTLGVEEQRVNVVIALTDPPAKWQRLGHGFRVEVAINEWQSGSVLQIPLGALFRQRGAWAVYKVVDGKAQLTEVKIGHANRDKAEVLDGLSEGDTLILYPGARVEDGTRITVRSSGL